MSPRIKWGLIAGGVVALFNICGGMLIGALNNCFSIFTVSIAAAVAGYFVGQQDLPEEMTKAGATAGAIVGGINLISQLFGGIIGGLVGTGIMASLNNNAQADPAAFSTGVGIGFGLIIFMAIIFGSILIAVGAGIGALTAKKTMPQLPASDMPETTL
jgi:hypothetical protein